MYVCKVKNNTNFFFYYDLFTHANLPILKPIMKMIIYFDKKCTNYTIIKSIESNYDYNYLSKSTII